MYHALRRLTFDGHQVSENFTLETRSSDLLTPAQNSGSPKNRGIISPIADRGWLARQKIGCRKILQVS
jgi:hypothetical protein